MKWKSMTVGRKISLGFGVVLFLLVTVGALSFSGIGGIVDNAKTVINGNQLDGILAQKEVDHLNWINKVNAVLTDENVTVLNVEMDHKKCGFGKWLYSQGRKKAEELVPDLRGLLKQIEEPHRKLHESAIEIDRHFQQADLQLGNFLREKKTDHLAWAHRVKDVFVETSLDTIKAELDPKKCSLGKWMYSSEIEALKQQDAEFAAAWQRLEGPHAKLHASAAKIQKMLDSGKRAEAAVYYMNNTKPLAYECLDEIDKLLDWQEAKVQGMRRANAIYANQTLPALVNTQKLLNDIRAEAKKHIMSDQVMLDAAAGTKRIVSVVVIAAIVVGIIMAYMIARGIAGVLNRVSVQMAEGSDQVAAASGQVSSASQSLAEGASEQAASIEETSSSLEEMSSMTKQNADNANQADTLMKAANQVVIQADQSMSELTGSMQAITRASDETSKIIKTIDEIAFQTNLLALNAAVEAARAGEAGAGFAVVADEVRNLAMRAADAARSTAALIETTVNKVGNGEELVARTNEAFGQVAENASKVGELVAEIAAASNEQSQGIQQVNTAVGEMDRVVQQNAADAEEAASAAEEMNAQAEQMKAAVGDLMQLVGASTGAGMFDRGKAKSSTQAEKVLAMDQSGNTMNAEPVDSNQEKPKHKRLLSMEDGSFSSF